jgi:hypothetical protein
MDYFFTTFGGLAGPILFFVIVTPVVLAIHYLRKRAERRKIDTYRHAIRGFEVTSDQQLVCDLANKLLRDVRDKGLLIKNLPEGAYPPEVFYFSPSDPATRGLDLENANCKVVESRKFSNGHLGILRKHYLSAMVRSRPRVDIVGFVLLDSRFPEFVFHESVQSDLYSPSSYVALPVSAKNLLDRAAEYECTVFSDNEVCLIQFESPIYKEILDIFSKIETEKAPS